MKRWPLQLVLVVILFFGISYLLGSVDYWRVESHKRPLFVLAWNGFFDGGTYVGLGFGYYVIANHGCKYALDREKNVDEAYWTDGPELKFWLFPFLNKADLKFRTIDTHLPKDS